MRSVVLVSGTARAEGLPISQRRWLSPVMRVLNVVPRLVLRSPLHGLMSDDLMLLGFTGRTSGRTYVIPVSYVEDEGTLLVGTDLPWRKNIRTGGNLSVWFKGRERRVRADVFVEEADVERLFGIILPENPALGRFLGLRLDSDGRPNRGDLQRAVGRGVAVMRLHLA
jgi:hypothetical protein